MIGCICKLENDVIVTIRHNPLVQRALQHAFFIPLLMDSNGF